MILIFNDNNMKLIAINLFSKFLILLLLIKFSVFNSLYHTSLVLNKNQIGIICSNKKFWYA